MAQGILANRYRHNRVDAAARTVRAETRFPITASDKITKWLTIQPDLQYAINPGADASMKTR